MQDDYECLSLVIWKLNKIITKKILRIEAACDICDSLLMQLSGDITSLLGLL